MQDNQTTKGNNEEEIISREKFLQVKKEILRNDRRAVLLGIKLTGYGFYMEKYRNHVTRRVEAHYKKTQSLQLELFSPELTRKYEKLNRIIVKWSRLEDEYKSHIDDNFKLVMMIKNIEQIIE